MFIKHIIEDFYNKKEKELKIVKVIDKYNPYKYKYNKEPINNDNEDNDEMKKLINNKKDNKIHYKNDIKYNDHFFLGLHII